MFKYLFFLIFLLPVVACQNDAYFNSDLEIPENTWEAEKAAVFDFRVDDTLQSFNLLIKVENTPDYRYSNLWLLVKTFSAQGDIAYDTLEYILADEKGKWLGKKQGAAYLNFLPYKTNVRFPKSGSYSVEIIQLMRDLKLNGIAKVGFRMDKVK